MATDGVGGPSASAVGAGRCRQHLSLARITGQTQIVIAAEFQQHATATFDPTYRQRHHRLDAAQACLCPTLLRLLGQPGGPAHWTPAEVLRPSRWNNA